MLNPLLPKDGTTPWERAMADSLEVPAPIASAINAMHRVKYVSPRPEMLPFLVYEYGLGELTPYVPNLYNLLAEGVRWQRLRGTISAVAMGLAWIGYTATVEEAWTGRRFWNSFQLRFPTLPGNDRPDLPRVEAIANLSVPKRSKLRRGVFQYDIPALQGDHTRLDNSHLESESGIVFTPAGTVWSFGRTNSFIHTMTEAEGTAIGNWIDPSGGAELLWPDVNIPWPDANFLWSDDPTLQRQSVMASWFVSRTMYVRLRRADGTVIGYRRHKARIPVVARAGGAFTVNAVPYEPSSSGTSLYVEAMTDFGDADGVLCTEAALIVGGTLAAGVKPGKLWLAPDELVGGTAIAVQTVNVPLRQTVRDQFKFLVRF